MVKKKYLTFKEAAKMLNITPQWLSGHLVDDGILPTKTLGRRRYISRETCQAYLEKDLDKLERLNNE
jgi:excisionase family DNA binding protein